MLSGENNDLYLITELFTCPRAALRVAFQLQLQKIMTCTGL